jgi:hypothetical protein
MGSMQCSVEFGYQLSICSGTKENHVPESPPKSKFSKFRINLAIVMPRILHQIKFLSNLFNVKFKF